MSAHDWGDFELKPWVIPFLLGCGLGIRLEHQIENHMESEWKLGLCKAYVVGFTESAIVANKE